MTHCHYTGSMVSGDTGQTSMVLLWAMMLSSISHWSELRINFSHLCSQAQDQFDTQRACRDILGLSRLLVSMVSGLSECVSMDEGGEHDDNDGVKLPVLGV